VGRCKNVEKIELPCENHFKRSMRMKKGNFCVVLIAVVLLGSLISACAAPTTTAPTTTAPATTTPSEPSPAVSGEVYDLVFANDGLWGQNFTYLNVEMPGREWQRLLYHRSNGRLRVKIIPKMFPAAEGLDAVIQGKADIANFFPSYLAGTYPILSIGDLPGIYSSDFLEGSLQRYLVYQDPKMDEIWDRVYRQWGAVLLDDHLGALGTKVMYGTKKVSTIADLEGMKVRISGTFGARILDLLGANSVTMSWGDVMSSLKTGLIDAAATDMATGFYGGLADVAPYATIVPLSVAQQYPIVMNASVYDSLPADLQQILREVSRDCGSVQFGGILQLETTLRDLFPTIGFEWSQLTPEEMAKGVELAKPVVDYWIELSGPLAPELLATTKEAVAKVADFDPDFKD